MAFSFVYIRLFSFLYHCIDFDRTWLYIWVTRRIPYKKQELFTFREHLSSPPVFWWGPCCSSFLVFCVVLLCGFMFLVPCCDVRYDFRIKTKFGSSLPPVVCRRACLIYVICVCLRIVLSNTYCVACFCSVGFRLVSCVWWCPTHITVCFVFFVCVLCLVYQMLPVSLDFPLLLVPSVSLTFIYLS